MFSTFVINLKSQEKRRSHMEGQLHNANIVYELIEAVDGRKYTPTQLEIDLILAKKILGRELGQGEIGCALSHKKAYQKCIESKYEYSLILEDDVVISKNLKEIIEHQIQKPHTWEYLSFDYMRPGRLFLRFWIRSIKINFKKQENIAPKVIFILVSLIKACYIIPLSIYEAMRDRCYKQRKNGRAVTFYRPLYLAGAYLINKKTAEILLQLASPIVYPADMIQNIARDRGMKHRAYVPLSVEQNRVEFGSNILGVDSYPNSI